MSTAMKLVGSERSRCWNELTALPLPLRNRLKTKVTDQDAACESFTAPNTMDHCCAVDSSHTPPCTCTQSIRA